MVFLPLWFLGGYFFFVTRWVPRFLLVFKSRAWLTRVEPRVFPFGFVLPGGWPELFLMFVQFGGLLLFLSVLTFVVRPGVVLGASPPPVSTPAGSGSQGGFKLESFLSLWEAHRPGLFFRPSATRLVVLAGRVLGGFPFFAPGRRLSVFVRRLRFRFAGELKMSSLGLSGGV